MNAEPASVTLAGINANSVPVVRLVGQLFSTTTTAEHRDQSLTNERLLSSNYQCFCCNEVFMYRIKPDLSKNH
jgi:hypothetical protein